MRIRRTMKVLSSSKPDSKKNTLPSSMQVLAIIHDPGYSRKRTRTDDGVSQNTFLQMKGSRSAGAEHARSRSHDALMRKVANKEDLQQQQKEDST